MKLGHVIGLAVRIFYTGNEITSYFVSSSTNEFDIDDKDVFQRMFVFNRPVKC